MKKLRAGAGIVLALVFATGCQRRAAAQERRPAPVVEVVTAVQQDVPVYGEWVGTLEGYVTAQIQPHVSGYLIRQDYREGSFVQKDQVLFEIDPRPFQATLDQARAQLAAAQAQLGKTKLDVNRDIPEAKAKAIPQSQLDNDTQSMLAARAAVQAGQAAVENAELDLGYTKVRSLIAGIAGIAEVQVGNLVGPPTVLTAVSQVDPIKVYFPVNEQEYLRMARGRKGPNGLGGFGQSLQLTLADGSVYPYRGRILFSAREVNQQTGTIRLVGSFPNPRNLLRPGQYARIRALTETVKNAMLVPQSAMIELQGSYQVAVVGADNRVHITPVEVGPTMGKLWVVTSGLTPGARVVSEGTQSVRDSEVVNPKTAAAPAGAR
ncbi:MAG: efflux RND transporter periplasmic adaptor subunit [Acidobacteriota bacterium]|nr:efflux RND transporter periplasmic adaptor subunit [Acidobacteriota bacterium]